MTRSSATISRAMLVAGALMILAGLGWGAWMRLNAPPPPTITDAGAVVLAVTGPTARPTEPQPTLSPTALPTATPTPRPGVADVERALSRVREVPRLMAADPTPSPRPPTSTPTPRPPTPTPTPSRPSASTPPTHIVAPAIKLDAAVVPMNWEMVDKKGTMVSRWVVPADAAGWHANSALPGHNENVVLSGHNNIEGKVFRYLVDLEPGDAVTLYAGDLAFQYTVTEKYILAEAGMPLDVRLKNAQWILPSGDERLTLVTCWPYEWPGNSHRVVVVARPVGDVEPPGDSLSEK